MNAPLFSLGTALSVSMIALAQSGAVIVAFGPPMSSAEPDLVAVDNAPGRLELTSLDPAWIHSYECDVSVLNCLLSRLQVYCPSVRSTPCETNEIGQLLRTNIPTAALLIE